MKQLRTGNGWVNSDLLLTLLEDLDRADAG